MSTAARALLLLAAFGGQGVLADPLRPWWNWSWEVLPRWASGQGATGFTNTTVAHYTDHFDLMWTQGTTCCPWSGEDRPGFATWEDGVETDLAAVHARRPSMPTFAYYGSYGCCSPYNNEWYPLFNGSNASALWLHDDWDEGIGPEIALEGQRECGHARRLRGWLCQQLRAR